MISKQNNIWGNVDAISDGKKHGLFPSFLAIADRWLAKNP
jgi:hypothetical protein